VSLSAPVSRSGSHDYAKRRRSVRKGRERGCWVYIVADELAKAGIRSFEPPPFYRVWGSPRGSVLVRLYREG
jgi:hypothetical protein